MNPEPFPLSPAAAGGSPQADTRGSDGAKGRSFGALRVDLAVLAACAAALFLVAPGARDLWDPNEPIYSQAVVEMSRSGDYLVPTVNGIVFAEKPPLYFWMALASGWLLGGLHEAALRVPLALGGILGVLLTYLLASPYVGRSQARTAALLLSTLYMYFWSARSVNMDLLALLSTLAIVTAVTRVLDFGAAPALGWSLAGLAGGLGFLAKGPITCLLPALALLLYVLTTGRLRRMMRPALMLGALVFILVAAPWYVALLLTGREDLLVEVLWRQNFTRFTAAWDHARPWWYYLVGLWVDMAPWGFFVPLAAALPGRSREHRLLDRLAWVWIFGVIAFLSFSSSKRSEYALPIAPAVAILASGVIERLRAGALGGRRLAAAIGIFRVLGLFMLAGAAVAVGYVPKRYPPVEKQAILVAAAATLCALATLGALALRKQGRYVAQSFYMTLMVLYLVTSVAILPALDRYKSSRGLSGKINALAPAGTPVASFRFWKWRSGFTYYVDRPIPNMITEGELREFWNSSSPVVVLVKDDLMRKARPVLGDEMPAAEAEIGGHTMYVFKSRPVPRSGG